MTLELSDDTKTKCCFVIGFERSIIPLIIYHCLTTLFALYCMIDLRKHEIMKYGTKPWMHVAYMAVIIIRCIFIFCNILFIKGLYVYYRSDHSPYDK